MSDSIIAQVKQLAEAQKKLAQWSPDNEASRSRKRHFSDLKDTVDFPALLAHMQAQQAMVAEAREERVEAAKRLSRQAARWLDDFIADSELIDAINGELAAALERMKP